MYTNYTNMGGFDTNVIEQHLAQLTEKELTAFVADIWDARGYQTVVDESIVTATKGKISIKIQVIRVHWWQSASNKIFKSSDIIVTHNDITDVKQEVKIVNMSDLTDIVAYGVHRNTSCSICEQHFDIPPNELSYTLKYRIQHQLSLNHVQLTVITLFTISMLIAGSFAVIDSQRPEFAESNDTDGINKLKSHNAANQSSEDILLPLQPADDELPPGVNSTGITDIESLASAHANSIGTRSHTIQFSRYRPADLNPEKSTIQRSIDITTEDDQYLIKKTEKTANNQTYLGAIYYTDGVFYSADWNSSADRHQRISRLDYRNVLVPTPDELRREIVTQYLSTQNTTIKKNFGEDELVLHQITGRGISDNSHLGPVQNYSVVALIDSRGIVWNVTAQYSVVMSDRAYEVQIEISYTDINDTRVRKPSWVDSGQQDPSGANRPV